MIVLILWCIYIDLLFDTSNYKNIELLRDHVLMHSFFCETEWWVEYYYNTQLWGGAAPSVLAGVVAVVVVWVCVRWFVSRACSACMSSSGWRTCKRGWWCGCPVVSRPVSVPIRWWRGSTLSRLASRSLWGGTAEASMSRVISVWHWRVSGSDGGVNVGWCITGSGRWFWGRTWLGLTACEEICYARLFCFADKIKKVRMIFVCTWVHWFVLMCALVVKSAYCI